MAPRKDEYAFPFTTILGSPAGEYLANTGLPTAFVWARLMTEPRDDEQDRFGLIDAERALRRVIDRLDSYLQEHPDLDTETRTGLTLGALSAQWRRDKLAAAVQSVLHIEPTTETDGQIEEIVRRRGAKLDPILPGDSIARRLLKQASIEPTEFGATPNDVRALLHGRLGLDPEAVEQVAAEVGRRNRLDQDDPAYLRKRTRPRRITVEPQNPQRAAHQWVNADRGRAPTGGESQELHYRAPSKWEPEVLLPAYGVIRPALTTIPPVGARRAVFGIADGIGALDRNAAKLIALIPGTDQAALLAERTLTLMESEWRRDRLIAAQRALTGIDDDPETVAALIAQRGNRPERRLSRRSRAARLLRQAASEFGTTAPDVAARLAEFELDPDLVAAAANNIQQRHKLARSDPETEALKQSIGQAIYLRERPPGYAPSPHRKRQRDELTSRRSSRWLAQYGDVRGHL